VRHDGMAGTVLQPIWNLDSSTIGARAVPAPSPPGVSHPQTPRSADRLTDNAMTLAVSLLGAARAGY
jgi:hypothetical protein